MHFARCKKKLKKGFPKGRNSTGWRLTGCTTLREESSPWPSIPYYPSCFEDRTQLGSGVSPRSLSATPLSKLIKRGTGRHPRFNTNLWCLLPPDAGKRGWGLPLPDPPYGESVYDSRKPFKIGVHARNILCMSYVLIQAKVYYSLIRIRVSHSTWGYYFDCHNILGSRHASGLSYCFCYETN